MFVLPLSRPASLVRRTAVTPAFDSALDRLFDESFDRFFGGSTAGADTRTPCAGRRRKATPRTPSSSTCRASTREQLKVSVEGKRVVAEHRRRAAKRRADGRQGSARRRARPAERVLYRERSAAVYARTVVLPAEVDQARSQAKFENGVLTLDARQEGARRRDAAEHRLIGVAGPAVSRPGRRRLDDGQRPARPHVEGVVRRQRGDAALQPHRRGQRDHRAVVGAKRQLREVHPGPALRAFAAQARAQQRVRADAAGDHEPVASPCAPARASTSHQHVDDRRLRRRGQVGARPARSSRPRAAAACVRTAVFSPAKEKSSESRCSSGRGKRVRLGIAELGEPRQRRPARIAEAEQLGRLVERLAGGIVDRVAEKRVARRRRVTSSSCVWPPETSRATKGNAGGSAERNGDSRWPSRWWTPSAGLPSAAASEQATPAPTSSAPASPGPRV